VIASKRPFPVALGKVDGICYPSSVAKLWRTMRLLSRPSGVEKPRSILLIALTCAAFTGCHAPGGPQTASISITQLPSASPGGPVQMGFIEGRVANPAPGQQIVIYARSGLWWIQPFANQPLTKIQPDLTWRNSTHLGTEYAVLLVDAGYHPASKAVQLPPVGNGVVAEVTGKGNSSAPIVNKTIHFSGFDWNVRAASSDRGGEPNTYDPENVWVDQNGFLHLRMQQHNGVWSCAELSLVRSLGYGSYRFVVQDTGHFTPSAVLGLYTADDLRTDDVRSELDIELSRWGLPNSKNAQFVVQPFYIPENVSRFMAPAGVLTHMFRWDPGRASFRTVRGSSISPGQPTVSEHTFNSGIPTPANETVHIDLYDYHHSKSSLQQPAEVVIEKFEYSP
jgi:hypothetical protein